MKTINTTLASHGQPFSSLALQFMQNAYTETVGASIIALIGSGYSASVPYILYGCVATVSTNTTITAGAIFYNGEVFIVPAQTFTSASGGNTILCTLLTTYDDVTPGTSFADGTFAQIRQIRSINYVVGPAGGSGVMNYMFDFNAAKNPELWIDGPALALSAPLGGGISGGTVAYNRYRIKGKTLYWQVEILNCTITGSCPTILAQSPIAANFPNNVKFIGQYNDLATLVVTTSALSALGQVSLTVAGGGDFTAGSANQSFTFNIVAELP